MEDVLLSYDFLKDKEVAINFLNHTLAIGSDVIPAVQQKWRE